MSNQQQQQITKLTKPTAMSLRWGTTINAGWTGVPTVLIKHAADLELDSLDLHILLLICGHWWTPENKPFVSKRTIADAIGVDPNTVRRRIQRMEKQLHFVRRVPRHSRTYKNSNQFELDGLKAALEPLAAKAVKNRKIAQQIRALRGQPERPKRYELKVV